jgi:hypothetical protein
MYRRDVEFQTLRQNLTFPCHLPRAVKASSAHLVARTSGTMNEFYNLVV